MTHRRESMNLVREMAVVSAAPVSSGSTWVTAIGFVGGATISGIVAVLLAVVQRKSLNDQADRQLRSHQDQFRAQTASERRKWLLEQRRSSYFEFLIGVERLGEIVTQLGEYFTGGWPRRDGVSATEIHQIDSLAGKFRERHDETRRSGQLVRLAGPSSMSDSVQKTIILITFVLTVVDTHVQCAKSNVIPSNGKTLSEAAYELNVATESFISQASMVLAEEWVDSSPHEETRPDASSS